MNTWLRKVKDTKWYAYHYFEEVSLKELTAEVIANKSARTDEVPDQGIEVYLDANATRINNARRTPVSPRGTYRF